MLQHRLTGAEWPRNAVSAAAGDGKECVYDAKLCYHRLGGLVALLVAVNCAFYRPKEAHADFCNFACLVLQLGYRVP